MNMSPLNSFIWARGRTELSNLDDLLGDFRRCCEEYSVSPDGTWTLFCKFSEESYRNIADGELEDIFRQYFPVFLDLKRFHEAIFEMTICVGGDHPGLFHLEPHLIAMMAALNVDLKILDGSK